MALRSRPTIKPWLPKLWRDPDTLQIGVDPDDGVLVCGVDAATADWLTGLDGSRSEAEVVAEAAAVGLDIATAVRILSGLARSGVLLSGPIEAEDLADTGPLLPELVHLSAALPGPKQADQALRARSRQHIVIDGANRIGVPLGALLAASGVGRLSFLDAESARRCDATVGGLSLADEGEPRVIAAQRAIRRVSANAQALTQATPPSAGLVILCQPRSAHDPLPTPGSSGDTAHLTVAVRDGTVVIGPLVLPGTTSCLRCAELHRADRDLRWPAVAAQLVAAPNRAVHEPTVVLATLAAALAAGQVLEHLDGRGQPEVIEGTLELRPPDWRIRRRAWPPHADCGCLDSTAPAVLAV
ncbi:TOMM precursor leader peptide-binding protein [soil metagenome]